MLTVAGLQVFEPDTTAALDGEGAHRVGQRHPALRGRDRVRIPAEERQGLHMDAAYRGQTLQSKVEDGAELIEVHPPDDGGHKDDPEAGGGTALDRLLLERREPPTAQCKVHRVVHPVELQEHGVEPGFRQALRVPVLRRQTQAVRVELEEGQTERPAAGDQLRQVVAHRGFSAGELYVATRGDVEEAPVPPLDGLHRGVRRRLPRRPREAHRALQIAARRDFEEHAARPRDMAFAEPARRRTGGVLRWVAARSTGASLTPFVVVRRTTPDERPCLAVFRTRTLKPHLAPAMHQGRRQSAQTDRAQARGHRRGLTHRRQVKSTRRHEHRGCASPVRTSPRPCRDSA